ncbi:MAG: putative DNA binding domain-containing protein [Trueperaceae bacterium]|nr:putative DNA binding domain-containing protein [Trueperaceae bacterium]
MTPAELTALLDRLIAGWENEVVEFKTTSNQYSADKTGEYVSAMANEANLRGLATAWMVFGINNQRNVVGTAHLPTPQSRQSLKHHVQQSIDQGLTIREIYEADYLGKRVVIAEIPAAPAGIPISWKGDYRARVGESLAPLSLDKLDQIRNQTIGADWTAVVVKGAAIADLDPAAIARARQGFAERHAARIPAVDIAAWDDATFLARARLTRNGGITRAAMLLLGSDTSTHLLTPHLAQLTWKLVGEQQAYEHFHLPFLLTASELASRIRNVRIRLLPPNQLIYREIQKYDERSILEALYNAIAHQDYARHGRIVVTEYVDRLEFVSIGDFYDGTPDEYRLGHRTPGRYRNPFLVAAMHELHLIDQLGYGIRRMVEDQVRRFLPLPDYDLSRTGEVKLALPGAVIDEAYSRLLMVRTDLPIEDVLALDRVQKGLPVTGEASARLRKSKLIEGRGHGVHVNADIAAITGKKAEYIRTRAQDDAHYARLVIDYLTQYGGASRKEIDDLLGKYLPGALNAKQQRSKVTNLLTRMRTDGAIRNAGTQQKPRWELV